jgi:hypothetical protein
MTQKGLYRNLTDQEVDIMRHNGCSCDNWNRISVKEGFDPSRCVNVSFSGNILLGSFKETFADVTGASYPTGIFNAQLHNCKIGSEVCIHNVGDSISNYIIEDKVVIRNCGKIHTEGVSSFGNGISVAVLSETGARAVKMWDRLSSHEAYIVAIYRHKSNVVNAIEKLVDDYSSSYSSSEGTIGYNSKIINCNTIRNVRIGPYSHIEGVLLLDNGSVNSCEADPVSIGFGVIMRHFIVCSGSVISDSAVVEKCFIGQGCILAKQFSADNSLFFANCEGLLGEACSILAGPYTVTHHKSTLLLAAYFSFMNAGSGSNQSNHMYKLGPLHTGIMERGSKTTSNSYLLWPSHIGAFSIVKGSHYRNLDSSHLPFSYLIESDRETILVPGINLKSVGTLRDNLKWQLRDRRKDPSKIDMLNYNMLSPYIINKLIEGRALLKEILKESSSAASSYSYNEMQIKRSALERGIDLYQSAINIFIGNSLIRQLEKKNFNTAEEISRIVHNDENPGKGKWVDLAGLIVPGEVVETFLGKIESGKVTSLDNLNKSFAEMHDSYRKWEWTSACRIIEEETGMSPTNLAAKDLISILEKWQKSVAQIDHLVYEDAGKEFSGSSNIGFGIDGDEDVKKLDFAQVRGTMESDSIIKALHKEIKEKRSLGDEIIRRLKKVSH